MFQLHPQLAKDSFFVGDLPLCRLVLNNDANYPWTILIPRRENITEIYQLTPEEQGLLIQESSALAEVMARLFQARKINVAALGNVVPQLHVHHIVRYETDPAWPAPVWGKVPGKPYEDQARENRIMLLRSKSDLPFV
ncbi:MAG: HIT domain-containing protein [Spirochaetia bacterium]|nr:HIT domain-containing protein [Spirochaetia bacterium]